MTSKAQVRVSNVSIPSRSFYLINVATLLFANLSMNYSTCYRDGKKSNGELALLDTLLKQNNKNISLYWYIESPQILTNTYTTAPFTKSFFQDKNKLLQKFFFSCSYNGVE